MSDVAWIVSASSDDGPFSVQEIEVRQRSEHNGHLVNLRPRCRIALLTRIPADRVYATRALAEARLVAIASGRSDR